MLDLEARLRVVVHGSGGGTGLGAPHADEIVVAGGQQLARSVRRKVGRLTRLGVLQPAQGLGSLAALANVPDAHGLVAARGCHRTLSTGLEVHGVDLLLVQLHRGGGQLAGPRVDDLIVADVIGEVNGPPVRGDVARAELIFILGNEQLGEHTLLRVEGTNGAVVRAREQTTRETAAAPLEVADVGAVGLVEENAVVAPVALVVGAARGLVVDPPQTDVTVLVTRRGHDGSVGVVRREVEVGHAARRNLGDSLVRQLDLRADDRLGGGEGALVVLERRALAEGSGGGGDARKGIAQERDERLIRALLSVDAVELDVTRGPGRGWGRVGATRPAVHAVGEDHGTVPPLVVDAARERDVGGDLLAAEGSARGSGVLLRLLLALGSDAALGGSVRGLRRRRRHLTRECTDVESRHPRLVPRDELLTLALELGESVGVAILSRLLILDGRRRRGGSGDGGGYPAGPPVRGRGSVRHGLHICLGLHGDRRDCLGLHGDRRDGDVAAAAGALFGTGRGLDVYGGTDSRPLLLGEGQETGDVRRRVLTV